MSVVLAILLVVSTAWHHDAVVTWYGPGLWNNRMACGAILRRHTVGVAHRTLPCGTLVRLVWKGHSITLPVVDRGPYGHQRTFDVTRAACRAWGGCFTRYHVAWHVVGQP